MEPLPKLPGNSFVDPTLSRFHRSQSLGYKNGYALPAQPTAGIGGKPINFNQLSEAELDELANYNPTLTYGQAKQAPPEDFVPAHVAWDKKVMKFFGYFKNTVHESPDEHFRVRPIELFYFLVDDSIAVVEPHVENSGLPQGKLIKRQRLPKNDVGDHWHWKDLNVGMNVTFYGKVFHLHDCDKWTREFLESEGIDVNPPEDCPTDPYADKRKEASALRTFKTTSDFDKLRQFLEMDRKVLRFYAVWDDRDSMFGELRKFIIHYYLNNDTLEIREVHSANDGRDPFPILIARQKVPKNRDNVDPTFPRVVMELSPQEIQEYFTPKDFDIGKTVEIERRRFFIYDCDNFTKAFYWKNFNKTDFTPVDVETLKNNPPTMEIAPFNGYGSLEDSLQSCLTLIPQPPKKDFIKMLENDGHVLRFEAMLDSPKPEDKGRRFIISYRLSDDMITIYEPPVKNSGIIGGKFLERTRVSKPGCTPDAPKFYGPADFFIGGVIVVYSHRFVIINADRFVLTYMEEHASQFPVKWIALDT
ncbi:hypothetical protein CAPTEDRAFT_167243 [Capitella teleta]|uniref:DM10 domain-containing protein n=1 Tax=Capitella teleta TaxID=283909 RepID=R7UHZ0_CAPTE|nr:hypothetical protein CAPTEDRAFT_167243 [Capitella teleta]|eukprot:ELU05830.1 hypothetical protein CAPTEDRAFT_167243 [Capitella teleta]